MLFILDSKQQTVGVASNSNPHSLPYFDDWHIENLEGINTYEFAVPSDHADSKLLEVEGHVIVRNLDGENLLFTIKEIQDATDSGRKVKRIFCEDTAITELLSDVQRPAKFESTTLEAVVTTILSNTYGWELGDVPYTDSYDVEFSDYTTVLEALRQVVNQFGKEMYFTVELNGTKIVKKKMNIVDERGTKTGVRFDYTYDLKGVGRTEDSSKIVTALVGIGKGDDKGVRVNLSSLPAFVDGDFFKDAGSDWIGSYTALQQFGKNGRHRFGVFLDEDSDTPEELKRRTLKELQNRIVPDVHYSASVTTLERLTGYEAKKVRLGDTIVVNDKSFEPYIVINGRIMELKRSYTRTDVDEVNLGKYKPITLSPNIVIRDLQKLITKSQTQWQNSGTTLVIEALGGNTFKNGSGQTTLKAKLFSADTEQDTDGNLYVYKWYKYDKDGNLITLWGGSTNYRTGKELTVTSLDVDTNATFICKVDNLAQGQITVFEVSDGEKGERGEQGLQGIQGEKGDQGIQGVAGKDGLSSYTHIAYANSADGTVGFSVSDSLNKEYIGMYVDHVATDSTDPSKYNWTLVKGQKGDQGIAGVKGADGLTPYLHIAYANNSTGTSGFSVTDSVGKLYIGQYTDFTQADSTDPTKYKWTLIKGEKGDRGEQGLQGLQGEKGDQGIQGVAGKDGISSYTHIAYATNSTGTTGFSLSDPTDKTYIGIYVDTVATDSTDPTKYKWTLIKGQKGDQGIQGQAGADGRTPYFHTAYANSADGVTGFSTTDSTNKLYIGTYTDFEVNDSTNPSAYTWVKIKGDKGDKGDQGIQGIQGVRGADGTTYYTWIKYADTPTSGMSDSPDGKTYMGIAYNKLTATESTNYADYSWSLIKGADGLKGADGKDGVTTYTWIKYADNELGQGMSDLPDGKRYLGIAYNKTTATESTNPSDYSWSPLYDNVVVGGRNLILKSNEPVASDTYLIQTYGMSEDWVVGETYTITINGSVNAGQSFGIWANGSATRVATITPDPSGVSKFTFTAPTITVQEPMTLRIYNYPSTTATAGEVLSVKLEKGNVATDYTVAPEDLTGVIAEIDERTSTQKIVETVTTDEQFTFILNGKANTEDISDMATGEQLTASEGRVTQYIDGRIDGEGGVNEAINAVSSSLEKTANAINAKFSSTGGINLIRNSIGYAEFDFWTMTGTVKTIKNQELEQLGFGSGFYKELGATAYIEQKVTIQPRNADGTLKKHSISYWLKKTKDNATNGWALVEVYANGVALIKIGKGSGTGTTNGWELGLGTFETEFSEITIRVTAGANAEAMFSGLMLNVGEDALQWQHANGEIYNTNIQMNLNGLKVLNGQTNGYTIMSPEEFSGYAEIIDDNGNRVMARVFTLNGATTEVTELDVDNEIKMQSVKSIHINTASNKGWAFIADE
jgi:phage minor structural protein